MFKKPWGKVCLGLWLLLWGAAQLLQLKFQYSGEITAALALLAGILILLDR